MTVNELAETLKDMPGEARLIIRWCYKDSFGRRCVSFGAARNVMYQDIEKGACCVVTADARDSRYTTSAE